MFASACASTTLRYAATIRCASCGVSGSTLHAQMRGVRAASVHDRQKLSRHLHFLSELLMPLGKRGELRFAQQLFADLPLVFSELLIDVGHGDRTLLHVLDVPLQEVMDRFHAYPDRPARLVLVDVLEREIRGPGLLDNAFHDGVDRRIVTTLEARKLEGDEVRMPRRELCRPDFQVRVRGIAVLADVLDFERIADGAGADLVAEESLQEIGIRRQRALRKHGVAEFLELLEDFVVQPGVVMVWPCEHHDTDALFAFQLIEDVPSASLDIRLVREQFTERGLDGPLVFFFGESEEWPPRLEQLL